MKSIPQKIYLNGEYIMYAAMPQADFAYFISSGLQKSGSRCPIEVRLEGLTEALVTQNTRVISAISLIAASL